MKQKRYITPKTAVIYINTNTLLAASESPQEQEPQVKVFFYERASDDDDMM